MPQYRVTANVLRIRSGPGTAYEAIGALFRNSVVQGDEINGDWLNVTSTDNKVGWSHRGFLELIDESPPPTSQISYRVDASTLNLRQGPGLNHSVIASLRRGEIVEGLAVSAYNHCAQVRKSGGTTVWASLTYLTKISAPPPPSPTDVEMIVTTDTLNVRSGPGTGYPIIGQVHRGETVIYLNASPAWDWLNIKTKENETGWCSSRYLMERTELFASPEEYPAMGLHRALSDSLPMRAGPGENHPVVVDLKFNRVVNVDELSPDGRWKHCTNAWGESGWYPVERLAKLGVVALQQPNEEFPYIPVAFAEFGTREIRGSQHNARILEYIRSTDLSRYPSLPDETEWCAAFVNWCVEKVGLPSTNSAVVNSWRNWGVKPPSIRRGCVITFRWEDGWDHMSFYLGEVGNYVVCLGGNQSDAVWISVYHKKYITSFRIPS
jgi:uncharacterized protein (TIGR02594 family)